MQGKVTWNKSSNYGYQIYKSAVPGGSYALIDTVQPSGDDTELYVFDYSADISGANGIGAVRGTILTWDEVFFHTSELYKIVPLLDDLSPSYEVSNDYVWLSGSLPSGASWVERGSMVWDNEKKFFSSPSLKIRDEISDHLAIKFTGETRHLTERYIVIWTMLDIKERPDTIAISLFDGSWNHRCYWGKNLSKSGTEGTSTLRYMGGLPSSNTWFPLVIDKDLLKASNVSGMSIEIYKDEEVNKKPICARFGSICVSNQRPHTVEEPTPSLSYFAIERKISNLQEYERIGTVKENRYLDYDTPDIFGYSSSSQSPNYTLTPLDDGTSVKIKWTKSAENGTEYIYKITPVDSFNQKYSELIIPVIVASNHDYTKIVASHTDDFNFIFFVSDEYGNEMTHTGLQPNRDYFYRLETYNSDGELSSTVYRKVSTKAGAMLDYFILDSSQLG